MTVVPPQGVCVKCEFITFRWALSPLGLLFYFLICSPNFHWTIRFSFCWHQFKPCVEFSFLNSWIVNLYWPSLGLSCWKLVSGGQALNFIILRARPIFSRTHSCHTAQIGRSSRKDTKNLQGQTWFWDWHWSQLIWDHGLGGFSPAFRLGPVCRGQFGEVLSFLRPTVHTIIECPRFPGTITAEWFLLCEPAVR